MFLLVHCDSYKTTEEHVLSLDKRSSKDTAAVMCLLREKGSKEKRLLFWSTDQHWKIGQWHTVQYSVGGGGGRNVCFCMC